LAGSERDHRAGEEDGGKGERDERKPPPWKKLVSRVGLDRDEDDRERGPSEKF
jgi:hypothetical protein